MQPEMTPERARLIAALTDQPFAAWPGYRWTKLGEPMRAGDAANAIAIHREGYPAAASFFRVWLDTAPVEHFAHVRGTGLSPQCLRWTINVPSASDAAALYALYWKTLTETLRAMSDELRPATPADPPQPPEPAAP